MRTLIILPALAAFALAGCGGSETASAGNEATANVASEPANADDVEANAVGNELAPENVTARVLTMNDRQRNVVFVRALMDAGLPCDGVIGSERLPDIDGRPMWRADCRPPGGSHMITVTPDGTAQIVTRADR
jgi:hypothetical protein